MDIVDRLNYMVPMNMSPDKPMLINPDGPAGAYEIQKLREKVNSLMTAIYEAGDLLDAGQFIDASNRLDEAKFNHNMEKVS